MTSSPGSNRRDISNAFFFRCLDIPPTDDEEEDDEDDCPEVDNWLALVVSALDVIGSSICSFVRSPPVRVSIAMGDMMDTTQ